MATRELEGHMGKADGSHTPVCGEPDAYVIDTDLNDPDWDMVSCERCRAHRAPCGDCGDGATTDMENKVQHTPGPWYSDLGRDGFDIGAQTEDGPLAIATVFDGLGYEHDDEAEPNARLIAAAPELLAALEFFHRWETDANFRNEQAAQAERATDGEVGAKEPWVERARAAIAKAIGENA